MPRKTAKQIVDEVVAKVDTELKGKPEHLRQCMVVVANGQCNCPAGRNKN